MQNKQNEIDNINELCNLYSLTDENFNEYYKKVMLFLTSNKKAGENKTLVIVSVEGITNDGKKITKDNFTDADIIANATDITINKVTFTVGDDSTSVNVEASPSNSNTIVLK